MSWLTWFLRAKNGVDKALESINKTPLVVKDAWITKGTDVQ